MQRTLNRKGFLLIVAGMLALFLIFYLTLNSQLQEKQQEETVLQESLNRLEDDNRELNAQLNMVGTEDYIVTSAMNEYAYMNKNDIRFEYTNPDALYAYSTRELDIMMEEGSE